MTNEIQIHFINFINPKGENVLFFHIGSTLKKSLKKLFSRVWVVSVSPRKFAGLWEGCLYIPVAMEAVFGETRLNSTVAEGLWFPQEKLHPWKLQKEFDQRKLQCPNTKKSFAAQVQYICIWAFTFADQ